MNGRAFLLRPSRLPDTPAAAYSHNPEMVAKNQSQFRAMAMRCVQRSGWTFECMRQDEENGVIGEGIFPDYDRPEFMRRKFYRGAFARLLFGTNLSRIIAWEA
jgi:hypothetical protein